MPKLRAALCSCALVLLGAGSAAAQPPQRFIPEDTNGQRLQDVAPKDWVIVGRITIMGDLTSVEDRNGVLVLHMDRARNTLMPAKGKWEVEVGSTIYAPPAWRAALEQSPYVIVRAFGHGYDNCNPACHALAYSIEVPADAPIQLPAPPGTFRRFVQDLDPVWDNRRSITVSGLVTAARLDGQLLRLTVSEAAPSSRQWNLEGEARFLPSPASVLRKDVAVNAFQARDEQCAPSCRGLAWQVSVRPRPEMIGFGDRPIIGFGTTGDYARALRERVNGQMLR